MKVCAEVFFTDTGHFVNGKYQIDGLFIPRNDFSSNLRAEISVGEMVSKMVSDNKKNVISVNLVPSIPFYLGAITSFKQLPIRCIFVIAKRN